MARSWQLTCSASARARRELAGCFDHQFRKRSPETRLPRIDRLPKILADGRHRGQWPQDFGEIILCDTVEEMLAEGDRVASEHVQ